MKKKKKGLFYAQPKISPKSFFFFFLFKSVTGSGFPKQGTEVPRFWFSVLAKTGKPDRVGTLSEEPQKKLQDEDFFFYKSNYPEKKY
jgi:hypothetical protein